MKRALFCACYRLVAHSDDVGRRAKSLRSVHSQQRGWFSFEAAQVLCHPLVKITKYGRCRTSDVAVAEQYGVEGEGLAVPVTTLPFVVLRRHHESERHFECFGN